MTVQMIASQLEMVISLHENVKEVCIIVSDGGQSAADLVAFVSPKEPADMEEFKKSINSFILDKTGETLLPQRIFIVDEIPKTSTGKLFRRTLHKMAEDALKE